MKAFLITLDGIEKEIDVDENTWEVRRLIEGRPLRCGMTEDEMFKVSPTRTYRLSSYDCGGIPVFRELGSYD